MAIPTTGSISIKEAAGSTRSIDTAVTSVTSGSLVALGDDSINYTGGRAASPLVNDTDDSPYSMLEYAGYDHLQDQPFNVISFLGRQASSGWMTMINESDSGGETTIITGPEFKFSLVYVSVFGITYWTMTMYVRRDVGGTNNVTYSQYVPASGSNVMLSTSTWQAFATYQTYQTGGWDSIRLDTLSHVTEADGMAGYTFSENNGESSTYNLNPAGTNVTVPGTGSRTWYYACRVMSTAEGYGYFDRTTTFRFRFIKAAYNDFVTPYWTHVFNHDHYN